MYLVSIQRERNFMDGVDHMNRMLLTDQQRTRVALGAVFGWANVAVFFFAYIPQTTRVWVEWVVMLLSLGGLVLVIGNAIPYRHMRFQQYGYLLTAASALFACGAFLLETDGHVTDWTNYQKFMMVMFLSTFALGGLVAHIETADADERN